MRLSVVTHDDMDGFLWGFFEGLSARGLLDDFGFDDNFGVVENPNHIDISVMGPNTLLDEDPEALAKLPDADAILFCATSAPRTNRDAAVKVIEREGLWNRVVHHDYQHGPELMEPEVARKSARVLVGHRDKALRCAELGIEATWLPRTGIRETLLRYHPALSWELWKDIPAIAVYHTFKPAQQHRLHWMRVVERTLHDAVVGSIAEKHDPSLRPPRLARACGTRHCTPYLELASRARIGVYLMGAHALGHQFWEFAALGCAIVAQHPPTHPMTGWTEQEWEHFDPPLVEGEDFVYFRTEKELRDVLLELDADQKRCEVMAARVFKKTQQYRAIHRSFEIMEHLRAVADSA